jgi:tetratricopeptide (TPR) repeat protein
MAAVLVASLALPPGLAQAAPRTREQREADARRACAAGKIDEGIEILADLYASYSHPNYIYNQGRCYQENGKSEQAIARFREYLRVATDAPPQVRDKVEKFIAELEGERQGPSRAPPPPVREPEPERPMPPRPAPVINNNNTVTDRLPPAPPPSESSPGLRAAAIVFGVVGGVGLVGGLVAGAKVSSLEKAVEDAGPGRFDVNQLAAQGRSAHRYETLQWVGYAVAGAGLIGAVICIMANNPGPAPRAESRWTIAGLPSGDPGLALAHRF